MQYWICSYRRSYALRRGGRKSDFAWNFLISKGPEKKSNAAIARYERANEVVAYYKGARTSRFAARAGATADLSRSVVSPLLVFEKRTRRSSLISGYANANEETVDDDDHKSL